MDLVLHVLEHALSDTAHLVPFLFVTYLVMEALEHTAGDKLERLVARTGRAGAFIGAVAGVVPQCGFSAAASTLYAGRVISVGTLVAVFLSTSDELLPIFVAEGAPAGELVAILAVKVVIAAVMGFAVDAGARALGLGGDGHAHIHDLCEHDHCACDHESPVLSALKHTLTVTVFIFLVTVVLDGVIETVGEDAIAAAIAQNPTASVFGAAVAGLIPNCAASVLITQLYLSGALGFPALMAGSLVSTGVGALVLLRTNLHAKENLCILGAVLAIGIAWGLVFSVSGVSL